MPEEKKNTRRRARRRGRRRSERVPGDQELAGGRALLVPRLRLGSSFTRDVSRFTPVFYASLVVFAWAHVAEALHRRNALPFAA